jgi:hypothetical protein
MPGGYPLVSALCNPNSIGVNLQAYGRLATEVAPNAAADTKGAWSQLIAATLYDASFAQLYFTGGSGGSDQCWAIDLGIGAAGSEQALLPNFVVGVTAYGQGCAALTLPLNIPAKTRISVRQQNNAASGNYAGFNLVLYDDTFGFEPVAGYDVLGFNASTTLGTAVSSGNAVKGAWTTITAATLRDYCGIFICTDTQLSGNWPYETSVDIGIGAAGSEKVLGGDFCFHSPGTSPFIYTQVPAGSRLSARSANDDNATQNIGVTIYGAYQ